MAQKEYLKMADAFREVVQPERFNYAMANPKATYAAHAINSHDELVAEVERLREHLTQVKGLCVHLAKCGGWDVNAYLEYANANVE